MSSASIITTEQKNTSEMNTDVNFCETGGEGARVEDKGGLKSSGCLSLLTQEFDNNGARVCVPVSPAPWVSGT